MHTPALHQLAAAALLVTLTACTPAEKPVSRWALLSPDHAAAWQAAGIPEQGQASVKEDQLTLGTGRPMTGAKFTTWQSAGLPGTSYSISYEARRIEGNDIFGMVTFPVSSHDSHATFVLGGWGGTVTGISSISYSDANENSTRGEQRFENHRWYHIRIEVRPEDLRAWVDGRIVVNASIKGKKVTLRPGDVDHCLPFGFATWNTTAEVRHIVIETLP